MNTTSLELSKRIATLEGDKGESEYWWFPHREMETHRLIEWKIKDTRCGSNESVPALTTDELLERLPIMIEMIPEESDELAKWYFSMTKYENGFTATYTYFYYGPMDTIRFSSDTPAEALGLLYEHLLIKGLIT